MGTKKQTATEWLYEQLTSTWFDKTSGQHILEQAKEMEKEQICNAYRVGWINYSPKTDSEQYYNETFKSE
jgi:hypothetical protein